MKWHDDIHFKQVKDDYDYIVHEYGLPCDFCGTLCNTDFFFSVLNGEITRKEAYIQMIEYFWSNGMECANGGCSTSLRPNEKDKRIQKIKERYLID